MEMTLRESFDHKKALETEIGVLKSRNTTVALRTALDILEDRVRELDAALVYKGFLEG